MRIDKFRKLFAITIANAATLSETAARNILKNDFKNLIVSDAISFDMAVPTFKEGKTIWESHPIITFTRGNQRVWMVTSTREVMCFNSTDLRCYDWQHRILRSMVSSNIRRIRKNRADRKSFRKNAWEPYNQSLYKAHGAKGAAMGKTIMDIIQYGMVFEYPKGSRGTCVYHNFQMTIPQVVELYEVLGTTEGLAEYLANPAFESFFKAVNSLEKDRNTERRPANHAPRNKEANRNKNHSKAPAQPKGLVSGIDLSVPKAVPETKEKPAKPQYPKAQSEQIKIVHTREEGALKMPSKPKVETRGITLRDIWDELDEETNVQQNLENAESHVESVPAEPAKPQSGLLNIGDILDQAAVAQLVGNDPITTL